MQNIIANLKKIVYEQLATVKLEMHPSVVGESDIKILRIKPTTLLVDRTVCQAVPGADRGDGRGHRASIGGEGQRAKRLGGSRTCRVR